MIIVFWALTVTTVLWYVGALVFIYHILSFRYPKDITLPMMVVFILAMAPASLLLIGYLADIYGSTF
jgi:branched-subunit amino acid transport protein